MYKNLTWKIGIIVLLLFIAAYSVYPPTKTLKPGIDLAGGTSLIYEINTEGLSQQEIRGLSERMITVLRRRIDPANIQNLVWRPQGNTRFEIQMPLASAEARQKRQQYEAERTKLLAGNIRKAAVMRALKLPQDECRKRLHEFAAGDPNKLEILQNLQKIYDERRTLRAKRDDLEANLRSAEQKIQKAQLDLDLLKRNRNDWSKLSEDDLRAAIKQQFTDANDTLDLLTGYVRTYRDWADVLNQLNDPENGKNAQFTRALRQIDRLNLSEDQLDQCLDLPPGSSKRRQAIEQLKAEFPDRAQQIEVVAKAYDQYRPFKGRLDDPKDLQRMLKGAGILEFRVLPTLGHPQTDSDLIAGYLEALKEKGPRYASDENYIWCECEVKDPAEWRAVDKDKRPSIVGQFAGKTYVLASNKPGEVMLQTPGEKKWKLERATQTQDQYGRRAISFTLDERGGSLFSKVTGKNVGRPLCILLDGIAISAPKIESQISRRGIITGSFTQEEQLDMINKLNAGSLPAMLIEQPIAVNTIGPSIGADNRDKGIRAGLIGLVVVMACMLGYYLLAGSIADAALVMNILFVLAIMAFLRATFTLPGIAGIILTIGMSVDANVLIFERIREEHQKGASLRIAITNGYQRAFRTIFDANLTTFITAAILYWVASEEIKGFAIVLMLGIVSSMFTALFVTRVIFDILLWRRLIKDKLVMLRLIHNPKVNWMRLRPLFLSISMLFIAGGLFVFFSRTDKYDIEFTGGTSVQTNFKDDVRLTREQVEKRIAAKLESVNVYSIGKPIGQAPNGENIYKEYEINTSQTNRITVDLTLPPSVNRTPAQLVAAINTAQNKGRFSGTLTNLKVIQDAENPSRFTIQTSQMNQALVKDVLAAALPQATIGQTRIEEIVNDAVLSTFADELEVQQNLRPTITSEEKITQQLVDRYPELVDFVGGLKIAFELDRPVSLRQFEQRLAALRFKPDTRNLDQYPYKILGPGVTQIDDPNTPLKSLVYVSLPEDAGYRQLTQEEWTKFAENERTKVLAAAQLETSLPRVRQFDPSVGAEAKTRAMIAIALSLFAIIAYIWVRFGNARYGIAAIIALVHDVCITLGAVTACAYIAQSPIGQKLLVADFKINLAMIAAFLTLIGYSLNDTIVVFDRIRENRGKARLVNPQLITNSINQTISRTILTSFTTFIVVLIMYIFGGSGLRGFTFAIGFGIIVGTYSSIAIAAPVLLIGAKTKPVKQKRQ